MNPGSAVVRSVVGSWHLNVEFNDHDWGRLTNCLIALSEANGGRMFFDAPLKQSEFDNHFRDSCEAIIQRAMRFRARQLGSEPSIPYRMVESEGPAPPLPSLKRRRSAPRIDIHKATRQMLIAAGGMSEEEAKAILATRKAARRLTDLGVLEQSLTKESWAQFKEQFCIHTQDPVWLSLSIGQKEFVCEPTLGNYVRVTEAFSQNHNEVDRKNALFSLLDEIRQEAVPMAGFNPQRITAASEIVMRAKVRRKARDVGKNAIADLSGVALLDKSQYLEFLITTLAEATESIRVIMFFMTHQVAAPRSDGKPIRPHALNRVLSAMRAAKERLVDVRVILDKDGPTDVFNSRRINRDAYRFFVDHDIPVVFSAANKVIHSKIVLVDGRHILLGSHNWTLGSMYNYDEKSVYLESKQLGKLIEQQFDKLWRNPEDEGAVRDQLLTTIERSTDVLREAGVYSADDFLQKTSSAELRQELTERSQLSSPTIGALRRELTLRDLESRMKKMGRRVPQRVKILERTTGPAPGRARVLSVIPGDGPTSRTVFTLTDQQGERHNLPFRLAPGTAALLKAKIVNQTGRTEGYRLRIEIGNEPQKEQAFSLAPGEETEHLITFNAPADGYKRMVRLTLNQGESKASPANSLYVVVTGDANASRQKKHRR